MEIFEVKAFLRFARSDGTMEAKLCESGAALELLTLVEKKGRFMSSRPSIVSSEIPEIQLCGGPHFAFASIDFP